MNGCVDGGIVAQMRQSWRRTRQGEGGMHRVHPAFDRLGTCGFILSQLY
jgi:hypothetical protein